MVEFHFACCAAFAKAKVVFTLIFNSVNILAHDFGDRIFCTWQDYGFRS